MLDTVGRDGGGRKMPAAHDGGGYRLLVVHEVAALRDRNLTLGLPHGFFLLLVWATVMFCLYADRWVSGLLFFGVFYALGRAMSAHDPYWMELLPEALLGPSVLEP